MAAYEMMVVTPAIANLIRENKTYRIDSAIQTGAKDGMFLLDDTLFELWQERPDRKGGSPAQVLQARRTGRPHSQAELGEIEDEDGEDEDEDEDEEEEEEDDD